MVLGFIFWSILVWIMAVGATRLRIESDKIENEPEIDMLLRVNNAHRNSQKYMLPKQNGYVQFETDLN